MIDIDEILKKTEKYDVITFDVFDTLLIRDVMKPADVFSLSYGRIGRYLRVLAEITAKRRSKNGEVTIRDIERCFVSSCDKEINVEKSVCRANPRILELVNRLKDQDKQVYAISDMYLGSETIREILRNCGYDLPVMVSCEHGCSKKDGSLFKVFLNEYRFDAKRVLHLGDNYDSDVEGAAKAGVDSVHIEKDELLLRYLKCGKNNLEFTSFINHGLNEITDPVERIGYEIVGPVILGFCRWVHEKYQKFGFERMYFLARDMHFVYDIYQKIYDKDEIRYLYVSRKALRSARKNPDGFIKYLKNNEFYGNISIVDTGWVGTAQIELEKYARMIDAKSDVGGLYIGTNVAFRRNNRSAHSASFLYSSFFEQLRCELSSSFMESLIGSQERQVSGYFEGEPVFNGNDESYVRDKLKKGAVSFASDWLKVRAENRIDVKSVRKAFENLFKYPHIEDIKVLENMTFDDVESSSIVTYKGREAYNGNFSDWLHDLSLSPWKGAFFRKSYKCYKLPLNAYLMINTFRNVHLDLKHLRDDDLG